jgi:NADH-quinone oxidoreductase subunit E
MTDSTETQTELPPLDESVHDTADRIVRRYPVARSALLPLLHLVQSVQNHITDEGVAFCAEKVGLTRAEVGAVATFYTMYKRQPVGDYLLSVCTNPVCKQAGGQEIYENYVAALGGHSDAETRVTVEHAECLGICDGAPVVQVNYEMFGPMTVAEGDQLLASCRKGQPPTSPWSGETPPTFNEVERDLSGANDAWEAELHKAAIQQIEYDRPPTYRTGETDIPVTHPGGDPAGVGGALFRQEASGNGRADVAVDDLHDVVADRDPSDPTGDPLPGDDSQRIAPGESDDVSIAAAGPGAPDADEVNVHPDTAEPVGGDVPPDAPAMTTEPGPGDQPGDVGVLGDDDDAARLEVEDAADVPSEDPELEQDPTASDRSDEERSDEPGGEAASDDQTDRPKGDR